MITIVVAMGENRVIGMDGQLPWHLPEDLKHFKNITSGHPIIMGRKTYESIGRPLPNRTNIVITRQSDYAVAEGVLLARSVEEAVRAAKAIDEDIYIIGGAEIYRQTLEMTDCLELTLVKASPEGDASFPAIDETEWQEVKRIDHPAKADAPAYSFITLIRKET